MPGHQDHLADQGRVPDVSRPRDADHPSEARVRPDNLQARLERLPANHPSSPFRDDGTRKPSLRDLSDYELPLPDDPDSPADPDLSTADQARTNPDGSWDWKASHLESGQSRAADRGLAHCRETEGRCADGNYGEDGLTPAMRHIEAELDHGHLAEGAEKFALKDPDRFKEKLARLIERFPGTDPSELAASIPDGIRYTIIFDYDYYTEGVEAGHTQLTEAGYERVETKPSWESDQYKGVNSQWRVPSAGLMFEVQFHTQDSWQAKQKTHVAYEKIQDPRTPVDEVERLRTYQRQVSAEVPIPPGALEIQHIKKERQVGA